MAEILFLSRTALSKWESGSNMPNISLLVEISEFYEVDIKEIIDGSYVEYSDER